MHIESIKPERPAPSGARISLVTYIYNDGELADGLLASLRTWTVKPWEIIMVDDGSLPPYVPEIVAAGPDSLPAPILTRLNPNQGVGVSKAHGLNTARGDFILSMDCDMRLPPDWLEKNLLEAARPETGIVGASVLCSGGDDLVSCYLRLTEQQLLPDGEVDFLAGSVWLMRKQVWDDVGGFGCYAARTHEDHHFCALVKQAGYKLINFADRPGFQVRKLSRHDMILRFAAWTHGNLLAPLREKIAAAFPAAHCTAPGDFAFILETVRAAGYSAVSETLGRIENLLKDRLEPAFIYFELLALAHLCLAVFKTVEQLDRQLAGGASHASAASLPEFSELRLEQMAWQIAVDELLLPFPVLARVFKADLQILGWSLLPHAGVPAATGQAPPAEIPVWQMPQPGLSSHFASAVACWRELFGVFAPLAAPSGIFAHLNTCALPRIIEEETRVGRHFSFYRDLKQA